MISENDFENEIPSHPANQAGVAIINKHAYKKVVNQDHISEPLIKEPSPSERLSIDGPIEKISSTMLNNNSPVDKKMERNLDKINNLVQKEIALGRVGVTREKAYRVIAQALDAKKWMDIVDKQGNVKQEYVDDLEKQRWGAEMAIKMFGDMIERKEIEYDVGDKTLERFKALSVSELKARAADLLLGKKGAIDAEITRG